MKKNLLPFLVASLLIGGLIGCTSMNQEIDHVKTETLLAQEGHLVYSNLLDEASREEVLNRLSAAGVLPKDVETADILIQDYN